MSLKNVDASVSLNAYPDSLGGNLSSMVSLLSKDEFKHAFSSLYLLPSIFQSDIDRGFGIIRYDLNPDYASEEDMQNIRNLGISFTIDFLCNHLSMHSPQFQDILKNGQNSKYKDFFINWNKFWEGHGTMTEEGYIQPDEAAIGRMFFRKPGLPFLMVPMPDGTKIPYWNTFYQDIDPEKGIFKGQMDLNIKNPMVWDYYKETLAKLHHYGAKIIRLDAVAYADKQIGARNFMNEPGIWNFMQRIDELTKDDDVALLPQIHASYEDGVFRKIADHGYLTYDFFLPGLILDAFATRDPSYLVKWAKEIKKSNIKMINMLGSHDGIPMIDLTGLLPQERIDKLTQQLVDRGGYIKKVYWKKDANYQVNATYYSALGEDDRKLLMSRAIQLFMPGKPQIWYLDLFAGKNDYAAVKNPQAGGIKEINRTNLSNSEMEEKLKLPVVQKQLEMIRFRNTHPAFGFDSQMDMANNGSTVTIRWTNKEHFAQLECDFETAQYTITHS